MATNDNDPATLLVEALRRMETNEASLHRLEESIAALIGQVGKRPHFSVWGYLIEALAIAERAINCVNGEAMRQTLSRELDALKTRAAGR